MNYNGKNLIILFLFFIFAIFVFEKVKKIIYVFLILGFLGIVIYVNIKEKFMEKNDDIPKNIYLCYKTKKIPKFVISNWKKLNPEYNVILYDDKDCKNFLLKFYGDKFVNIFNFLKDWPIKSDFWRCCILHTFGGVYADIDIKPLMPLNNLIIPNLELLTIRSGNSNKQGMTPELIICKKNNKLLKMCIDTYLQFFDEKKPYDYWGWSIVPIMQENFHKLVTGPVNKNHELYYDNENKIYRLLDEIMDEKDPYNDQVVLKDKIVLYNRYKEYKDHNY